MQKLAELLRDSIILNALNNGGVDNWDWYGDCFTSKIDEELDLDDEDLVKSEGFTIQDTDDLFG